MLTDKFTPRLQTKNRDMDEENQRQSDTFPFKLLLGNESFWA